MGRIISVSRRTDVPAFYGPWFTRRIQEGFAGVVAPYGGKRYLVSLAPQDVNCFVFWSKDFTPFVPHLDTLDHLGYRFYFNYTLTALPAAFETNVDKAAALKTLQYLGERYSPRRREWQTPDTFQTCHQRSFGANDDFPWGKAVPVVARYNGTTAGSESPWCLMLAVQGERK